MRKPQLHRIFAVPAEVGLASIIGQDAELADAVQETPIHDLWVLPCGPVPSDPAELLTSPRFPAPVPFACARSTDYVVIDSPPLLAVTDACVVAPRVDGVLLVVRRVGRQPGPLRAGTRNLGWSVQNRLESWSMQWMEAGPGVYG